MTVKLEVDCKFINKLVSKKINSSNYLKKNKKL